MCRAQDAHRVALARSLPHDSELSSSWKQTPSLGRDIPLSVTQQCCVASKQHPPPPCCHQPMLVYTHQGVTLISYMMTPHPPPRSSLKQPHIWAHHVLHDTCHNANNNIFLTMHLLKQKSSVSMHFLRGSILAEVCSQPPPTPLHKETH